MAARTRKTKPDGEWLRQSEAARALGLHRSTLVGQMARNERKTKVIGGVPFVWVAHDERQADAA